MDKVLVRDKEPGERMPRWAHAYLLGSKLFDTAEAFGLDASVENAAELITVILATCNIQGHCWEEVEAEIVKQGKEFGGYGAGIAQEKDYYEFTH